MCPPEGHNTPTRKSSLVIDGTFYLSRGLLGKLLIFTRKQPIESNRRADSVKNSPTRKLRHTVYRPTLFRSGNIRARVRSYDDRWRKMYSTRGARLSLSSTILNLLLINGGSMASTVLQVYASRLPNLKIYTKFNLFLYIGPTMDLPFKTLRLGFESTKFKCPYARDLALPLVNRELFHSRSAKKKRGEPWLNLVHDGYSQARYLAPSWKFRGRGFLIFVIRELLTSALLL